VAASDAIGWAVQLVGGNAEVVDVRVCAPEIYESEALRPDTPDLLAATDVAELLGVSRQRVHQLAREHPRFPAPYVRLGSGPIWSRPAIEHFDRLWTRKPGRPARAS
jgi:predicted DNA-binding transcriptional regulator AlpA